MKCLTRTNVEAVVYELFVFAEMSAFQNLMATVTFVVEQYMSDVLHVYTDLVGTSGFEYTFHKCDISQTFQYLIVRNCMFSLSRIAHDSHLHTVFGVTSDVSSNCTFIFFYDSPYQSIIFTFGCFIVELHAQTGFGIRSFGYYQKAGSIFVNTVNQSYLRVVGVIRGDITQMPGNGINQCTVIVSTPRMNNQTGRFIDNHQVIVFVYNVQRDIFRDNVVLVARTIHHDSQHIKRFYLIAAFYRFPVCHHKACICSCLNAVAGCIDNAFEQIFVDTYRCLSFIYYNSEMFV